MKRTLSLLFMLAVLLAACAPADASPEPTEPAVAEPPAEPAPPDEPAPPLAEAPIELAGPPMEVGSRFRYVDGSILVAVPAGEFIMGHGGFDNPEHVVFLSDFWIYRTEVTNGQYARCVELGQCSLPDLGLNLAYGDPFQANKPVTAVDYEQAAMYCGFVHGRLPTEAEWEKTGRGPEGSLYSWGDAVPTCDLANVANCVSKATEVIDYPQGQSFYEALDMVGNSFEWVGDWYLSSYYGESPPENPFGPETGLKRSVRSTSFRSAFNQAELARRWSATPVDRRDDLGFRCVVEDPTFFAPYCEYLTVYGLDADGDPVPGDSGSVDCPTLSINANPICVQGNTPLTTYTFGSTISPPPPLDINVGPNCAGGPLVYDCTVAGEPLSICQDCVVTPGGPPTCPPDYTQVGNTCIRDLGYPGECLPGYNFDPVTQCCQAEPGLGNSFPLCPVGTYDTGPANGCVDFPAAAQVCKNDSVYLKTVDDCTPGYNSLPNSSSLIAALEKEQDKTPVAPVSGILTLTTLTLGFAGWIYSSGRKRS